jgi:hypothetical protein
MEFAKQRESGLVFLKIVSIKISMVPTPRQYELEQQCPELSVHDGATTGACTVELPASLKHKLCCLNIQNKDNMCFRYCLIAWRRGVGQEHHSERPQNYHLNPPRGRPPKGYVPQFDDAGLDFSMLQFPVSLEDIGKFEEANNIGVYVFGWTVRNGRGGFATPIRRPESPYKEEVQLVLYNGHYLLVTRFPPLMSMQHINDNHHHHAHHLCHRCTTARFKTAKKLQDHLDKAECLMDEPPQPKARLPEPFEGEKVVIEKFRKHELRFDVPIVVYADFETYQARVDEKRTDKMTVERRMCGAVSFAYYVKSLVPSIASGVQLHRGSADEFVMAMLELGLRYRYVCAHPVAIRMTPEDKKLFDSAKRCYLCGYRTDDLVKDHDHFTGEYRGAACARCNIRAQLPREIVVMFHNAEAFDMHEIVNAVVRLRAATEEEV